MTPADARPRGSLTGFSHPQRDEGSQIVSAWHKDRREYDYYAVPRRVKLRMPPPPEGRPAFGEAIEALLPSLPRASKHIGSGQVARGRIVVDRQRVRFPIGATVGLLLDRLEDVGTGGIKQESVDWLGWAVIGAAAWWLWRNR